jgi:adenylate cyclase
MGFEIERKFLVRNDEWRRSASSHSHIRQAYLDGNGKVSIRVRIKNGDSATLTIKSRPAALRRLELEYAIPVLEAEALMPLREGIIIEKTRYLVPHGGLTWEIDVFGGDNAGLVIAEIELPDEHHAIELPAWIRMEVTGQAQYYNSTLARRPYASWTSSDSIRRFG